MGRRSPRPRVAAVVTVTKGGSGASTVAFGLAAPGEEGAPRRRPEVLYAGSTLRNNPLLVEILGSVTALVGARASFLPLGEFTGALGALARVRSAS